MNDANTSAAMTPPAIMPPTNVGAALGAGLAAAIAGAILWAAATVVTRYQIGFMAVGVGLLVGWAVCRTGRSGAPVLGIVGAVLALSGCVLGNLLSAAGFAAQHGDASLAPAVAAVLAPSHAITILQLTFSPMDVLFYAIAVYEGYKIGRKPVTS